MCQLAAVLKEQGVKRGDRIGIYMNRSLETAIAIYGILQAGAVYVPLDPLAPPARLRFVINDCGIKHLVTNASQRRNLPKLINEEIALESVIGTKAELPLRCISWEEVRQMPDTTDRLTGLTEHDLAYILYTSGSTGTPKGIMHTHHSGLAYARLTASTYGLNEKDKIGNHAPIHFDISTLGYLTAPLIGATTTIVPDAHTKMPASLSQLIEKDKLTVWYSVPLALIQLLQRGVLEERDLSSLRWVFYAGEAFPVKHLRALMQQWPQARFSNIYGPTETNQCTNYDLPGPPQTDDPIPIGKVWENTQMLILDEDNQAVPRGEKGELLIRSTTMMAGYWQQPERTRRSFYTHETVPGFKETYYRTGDLVAEDEQGLLHFYGRKDHQIKTRGYRVELGEIETLLVSHPAVHEIAVFPHRNEEEEVAIIAAIILKTDQSATEQDFVDFLKNQLPWYAVPQQFILKTTFPRTSTGKVDRKALQKQMTEQTI